MIEMNVAAANLGVYRMMQGHMSGLANQQAVKSDYETTQAIIGPVSSGQTKGMAFALQREQALTGQVSPTRPYEPVLEVQDPIRRGDITQLNANSVAMAQYMMGVMSGCVEGPMPMSAMIARQRYEQAMGFMA